jgi:ketosteroid isomerase-like protein
VNPVERVDDRFFAALVAADVDELDGLLATDFVITGSGQGPVIDRDSFIASVGSGLASFDVVKVSDRVTRRLGNTAIVVGCSRVTGRIDGLHFEVSNRFTHVLMCSRTGSWRLVNAHGPEINQERLHDAW